MRKPSYRSYPPAAIRRAGELLQAAGGGWPTIWRGRGKEHDHRSLQPRVQEAIVGPGMAIPELEHCDPEIDRGYRLSFLTNVARPVLAYARTCCQPPRFRDDSAE